MLSQANLLEKRTFQVFERTMQPKADLFYQLKGYRIIRNGDKGKDLTLTKGNRIDKIEEKFRREYRDDILIEIIQDLGTNNRGWFYETKCDHLHYFFCVEGVLRELCRIEWDGFKLWFLKSFLRNHSIGNYIISYRGYGITLNIPVPKKSIPIEILDIYTSNLG